MDPEIESIGDDFPVLNPEAGIAMREYIAQAKAAADSVGGIIECAVTGLPAGIGEPMFGGVESRIAQILYGIPAVKGVEFGIGFDCACIPGSQSNDDFAILDGKIVTATNNAVLFSVAIKATPSIGCRQNSVRMNAMEETPLEITGRHDPCIVPRAVPVVEAAAAIAIYDMILGNTQTDRRK